MTDQTKDDLVKYGGRWLCVVLTLAFYGWLGSLAFGADQKPLVINPTTGKQEQLQPGNRLTLPDASGDLIAIGPGVQTAARVLSLPVLTGDRTLALIDQAQSFSVNQTITANTASTNTTTGALVVTGGTGIGGALNVGGNIMGATAAFSGSGAGAAASQLTLDQYAATDSRIIGWGPNNTTRGGIEFWLASANASNILPAMFLRESGVLILGTDPGGTNLLRVGGALTINSATMIHTATAFTNGAAAQVGTLTNAPAAGNPTKWVPINDNGTTRYIPAW